MSVDDISEVNVKEFECLRQSGKFNMITDQVDVMSCMHLNPRHKKDRDIYYAIVNNYSALIKKFGIERKCHEQKARSQQASR